MPNTLAVPLSFALLAREDKPIAIELAVVSLEHIGEARDDVLHRAETRGL
jgi:hypothetical protein